MAQISNGTASTSSNVAANGVVTIFDTTLRDGEQAPGISLDAREKVEIATQLARLQVDVIEAGFPVASKGDFAAVQAVAEEVGTTAPGNGSESKQPPVIAALARCLENDIQQAAKAIAPALRKRIHVFLSTSDIHRRHMLRSSQDEVLTQAVRAVELAKTFTDDVQFCPQDATRTDFEFLVEIVAASIEAGATTVNITDTVGYALPHDFGRWIAEMHRRIPAIDAEGVTVSVHCHNDLGLAVANSIEAVRNGARQIEVAINGIGERAGNCSLEEAVMAIATRSDLLALETNIHTPEITRTSRLVSALTGYSVQANKAVVGSNAFAHESGIHQHGILQDRQTYEIMKTEDVGADASRIVLGKHSGRHAFRRSVAKLGFNLAEDEIERAFTRFKDLADRKKDVDERDIEAVLASEVHDSTTNGYELSQLTAESSTGSDSTARVSVRTPSGETCHATQTGDGMVDAACGAIRIAIGRDDVRLVGFRIGAVSEGVDALGEVIVQLQTDGGVVYTGRAVATDIVQASAEAYIDAINRSLRVTPREPEFTP